MAHRYILIGRRLLQLRNALGMSQSELAKKIKCGANALSQYEKGKRRITLNPAERLCDLSGATLDWIYRGDERWMPGGLLKQISKRHLPSAGVLKETDPVH